MSSRNRSTAQLQLLDGGQAAHESRGVRVSRGQSDIDWVLDERTRSVGKAGVAAAKAILQQISPPQPLDGHRRAS